MQEFVGATNRCRKYLWPWDPLPQVLQPLGKLVLVMSQRGISSPFALHRSGKRMFLDVTHADSALHDTVAIPGALLRWWPRGRHPCEPAGFRCHCANPRSICPMRHFGQVSAFFFRAWELCCRTKSHSFIKLVLGWRQIIREFQRMGSYRQRTQPTGQAGKVIKGPHESITLGKAEVSGLPRLLVLQQLCVLLNLNLSCSPWGREMAIKNNKLDSQGWRHRQS